MNTPAAERLWKAMEDLWNRIDEHCQKVRNSPLKLGVCTVSPKSSGIGLPTPSIQLELENQARKYFDSLKEIVGFHFQYWTPPKLPIIDRPKTSSIDDYEMLSLETHGVKLFYKGQIYSEKKCTSQKFWICYRMSDQIRRNHGKQSLFCTGNR